MIGIDISISERFWNYSIFPLAAAQQSVGRIQGESFQPMKDV
jgi:hypothetical protein